MCINPFNGSVLNYALKTTQLKTPQQLHIHIMNTRYTQHTGVFVLSKYNRTPKILETEHVSHDSAFSIASTAVSCGLIMSSFSSVSSNAVRARRGKNLPWKKHM